MNKQQELLSARRLWEKMLELESLLFDHYDGEFMEIDDLTGTESSDKEDNELF